MATVFIEGFDKYSTIAETTHSQSTPTLPTMLTANEWTSATTAMWQVAGLSATGMAIKIGNRGNTVDTLLKTLSASFARALGGFRFQSDLTGTVGIIFGDTGTNQCSISILTSGLIRLTSGSLTGTTIATSTASVSANSTHYLEWDITIGPAGSAYNVYLDGVSVFSGTATTRSSANSTYNQITLGNTGSNPAGGLVVDDLYIFDTTTSFNNAVLLTNPRIETQLPSSDTQTQFASTATMLGTNYASLTTTNAPGANQLFLRKFSPAVAMTVNSVSTVPGATSATAKLKAVIYSDSSGSPGTLLSSGTEVIGTTSGVVLTGALTTPQALTAGTNYWIGFITDTSVALWETDTGTTGQRAANTYTSGAPGTAPSMTTGQANWLIYGNCTGASTNWSSQAVNPAPGATGDPSNTQSSTVSNEDLYGFPALTTNPTNVYTLAVKGNVKKDNTGARTIDLRTKSSTTDSAGSSAGQAPSTSYGWLDSYFDTDPATSAAWAYTAINAAKSGMKVAS